MRVVIQIASGPDQGRKTWIRTGQTVEVGHSEYVDLAVPNDASIADVHFSLRSDGNNCLLRDLSEGRGTFLQGELITDAVVFHGDQIQAGDTRFAVAIEGGQPRPEEEVSAKAENGEEATEVKEIDPALLEKEQSCRDYLGQLDKNYGGAQAAVPAFRYGYAVMLGVLAGILKLQGRVEESEAANKLAEQIRQDEEVQAYVEEEVNNVS